MRGLSARFLAGRLARLPVTVAGILAVAFLLLHLAPGDPVLAVAGEHGDAAYYEAMRARFGLDRPLAERFVVWSGRTLRGELGHSWVRGRPVGEVLAERVPATLLLAGTALLVTVVAGVLGGLAAAALRGRAADALLTGGALVLWAAPSFWLGQMAILWLAFRLGWFPVQGMRTAGVDAGAWDVVRHLALPALVLGAHQAATVLTLVRSGVVAEVGRDYVRSARAKGLGPGTVYVRHALPGALLPVATLLGHRLGRLLGGAAVVEIVFGWPGLGRLLVESLQTRDLPVVMGIFLLVSASVVVANVLTDAAYGALDPRVELR